METGYPMCLLCLLDLSLCLLDLSSRLNATGILKNYRSTRVLLVGIGLPPVENGRPQTRVRKNLSVYVGYVGEPFSCSERETLT